MPDFSLVRGPLSSLPVGCSARLADQAEAKRAGDWGSFNELDRDRVAKPIA